MLFWYHFPIHCFYVFGLSFKRMIRTHAFIIFFCCYFLIKTNATSYFVFEVQTHDTVFYNVSLLLLISYIILKAHYCRFSNLLIYSSWKKEIRQMFHTETNFWNIRFFDNQVLFKTQKYRKIFKSALFIYRW